MTISELVPIVVGVLSLGGIVGGVIALLKLRPEAGAIVVTAAQGALIVQAGVIDSLQDENKRLQDRVTALEALVRTLRDEFYNGGRSRGRVLP